MFRSEDTLRLNTDSRKLLKQILYENREVGQLFFRAQNEQKLQNDLKILALSVLKENPVAYKYYKGTLTGRKVYDKLRWKDFAAIRLLDYINHAGEGYVDMNLRGKVVVNNPIRATWSAIKTGTGPGNADFYEDMLLLFRQLSGRIKRKKPNTEKITEWMARYSSGLDPEIIEMRKKNRDRILKKIINKIDSGQIESRKFKFKTGLSDSEKIKIARKWWNDSSFHLRMAIRSASDLNEFLDYSLDKKTMVTLKAAEKAGIPFFVNPYYLSLLNIEDPKYKQRSDLTLRDYILANNELISEFGHINAWEKEDIVEPNQPNAAGWLLPEGKGLHRRYPEVAIFIPQSTGRSCGGLCVSCQRMYDFQSGHFNFNLEKLKPRTNWTENLKLMMDYFRYDSQLRDILITGGDAFMSSDKTLEIILDHVFNMALQKIRDNRNRPEGKKFAEMVRVRLGTRLPVYLPHRFTPDLIKILKDFKEKASATGIKQFIIQTHFVSALEITPEARYAVKQLTSAGWLVTNQEVFTAAAARRGHSAKLRKTINEIGILPYYTFQVKGHKENKHNFTPIARSIQEQIEEKKIGAIPGVLLPEIRKLSFHPEMIVVEISQIKQRHGLPFLATDRNVLNLPGVGKSLTFRVIGLTDDGRRILEFKHDINRNHSPIIEKMGKVIIIESKSVSEFLRQLEKMGEDINEYRSIYGYSMGETEDRMPIYEYPEYNFHNTREITNLKI